LEFEEVARPFLQGLGAEFETARDLRLTIPKTSLPAFQEWFGRRVDREISAERELTEELVDEHQALPSPLGERLKARFVGSLTHEADTTRRGKEGLRTCYCFEVFSVELTLECQELLSQAAHRPSSRLIMASKREIAGGVCTHPGMKVARSAQALFEVA